MGPISIEIKTRLVQSWLIKIISYLRLTKSKHPKYH